MTLDEALARGRIDVAPTDPLHGCRTASAISDDGQRLYTAVETPIGGRSYGTCNNRGEHGCSDQPPHWLEVLDWTPGTDAVNTFKRKHAI